MRFREADASWEATPQWVQFLIECGYKWPGEPPGSNRITIISMPCDSAAAGILALGLLVRDLCNPDAGLKRSHFDYLLAYARQYLDRCRHCNLEICDPTVRRCGYLKRATGVLLCPKEPNVKFHISPESRIEERRLVWEYKKRKASPVTQKVRPDLALEWHVEGEPPAFRSPAAEGLSAAPYRGLIPDADIKVANLQESWAGLCLAVRPSQGAGARRRFNQVRFAIGCVEYSLDDLLAIHSWSVRSRVSRTVLFDSRKKAFDRPVAGSATVVADGAQCLLRILSTSAFQLSSIIAVIDRTASPDLLDSLGNRLQGLLQWYVADAEFHAGQDKVPKGIAIQSIKRVR
jgi:hypothetical protein